MSDKEVIVLEDSDEGKEATGFITILEAALLMERAEDALAPPLIRFNDPSTADLVVRVMPDGPLLSLHKSIVQANPFFASFRNFAEANGYAEITAPDPETCAFVIECLYHLSTSERVAKFDEIMFQEGVEWFVKHKFSGVLRNASFFMMDALLSRCYLLFPEIWKSVVSQAHFSHEFLSTENLDGLLQACDALSALEKLRIILDWAKGLTWDYNRNQLHRIVSKYINPTTDPTKSLTLKVAIALSEEFSETFDIVVPPSLSLKIAAGLLEKSN